MHNYPGLVFLGLMLVCSGCATVIRGTTDKVNVESQPSGARITLSDGKTGVTPATFELPRNGQIQVTCTLEGFESASMWVTPNRSKAGSIAAGGNALVGGLIGGAIDGSTGATMDLYPNPVVFKLRALRAPGSTADWDKLSLGLSRRDVRFVLGDPASVSDDTGDQVWTYADGGRVRFHEYFVAEFSSPEKTKTRKAANPEENASRAADTPSAG